MYSCSSFLSDEELQQRYIEARDNKEWDEAVSLLNEKIKRSPDEASLYFARAQAYSNLDVGKSKEMISDLSFFLDHYPEDYVARFLKAQALMVSEDYKQSIKEIDILITEFGKNPMLLAMKANAAFADKQFGLSEELYYEKLKLSGTYDDLKSTYYYWIFSKYFNGNKEGAQWDCAFLTDRGFKEDKALMKAIIEDKLNFDELSKFQMPNLTLRELDELITNNCTGIDIFLGENYFRSELIEQIAREDYQNPINQLPLRKKLDTLLKVKDKVAHLNLSKLELKELPKEVLEFKNLISLNISWNNFKDKIKLFEDLSKLPNLKILSVGKCNLISLPDNIAQLNNIEVLIIYANGLRQINENVGKLKKLKLLDVSNNSLLKDLPKSISELRCLKRLDVAGSGLIRLRDELAYCTELVSISANACKIKTLPEQVGNLINLRHFNLGYNKIEKVPISFAELTSLKEVELGSNEIQSLPREITKMKHVGRISLEFNRFKEFPKEILELDNLYSVWLHNNNFKEIPLELAKMPKIKRILLDHEVITDENIVKLQEVNPDLMIERYDTRRYVKGRKRKN